MFCLLTVAFQHILCTCETDQPLIRWFLNWFHFSSGVWGYWTSVSSFLTCWSGFGLTVSGFANIFRFFLIYLLYFADWGYWISVCLILNSVFILWVNFSNICVFLLQFVIFDQFSLFSHLFVVFCWFLLHLNSRTIVEAHWISVWPILNSVFLLWVNFFKYLCFS
jgi:hypothetical protein